jgi:hypothetical protein
VASALWGPDRKVETLLMAQFESSSQSVEISDWGGPPPLPGPAESREIAVQRPRLSEERITQLIGSLRRRATYPELRRVKRVARMDRMRRLLADWRAAERRLGDVSEISPDVHRLQADLEGLRDEYHRLFVERVGNPPGA